MHPQRFVLCNFVNRSTSFLRILTLPSAFSPFSLLYNSKTKAELIWRRCQVYAAKYMDDRTTLPTVIMRVHFPGVRLA